MVERVSLWMSARRCVECGANETLCNAPLPEAKTYPIDFMSIETSERPIHSAGESSPAALTAAVTAPAPSRAENASTEKNWTWKRWYGRAGEPSRCRAWKAAYGAHDAARGRLWCCLNHRQTSLHQNLDRRLSFCAGINKCANGAKRKVGSRRRQQ